MNTCSSDMSVLAPCPPLPQMVKRPEAKVPSRKGQLHGTSMIEIQFRCEMQEFFDLPLAKADRMLTVEGRRLDPDVLIPELNLVVEYDGSVYHAGRIRRDIEKTRQLAAAGYTVIRLREHPLQLLHPNDIAVPARSNAKKLVELTLAHIEKIYNRKIEGLEDYLQETQCRRAQVAQEHIDDLFKQQGDKERNRRRKLIAKLANVSVQDSNIEDLLFLSTAVVRTRANYLNRIFARWDVRLLAMPIDTLRERVQTTDTLIKSKRWRSYSRALSMNAESLAAKVALLDEIFDGRHWTRCPMLLGYSDETIVGKAQRMDQLMGNSHWKKRPDLMSLSETLLASKINVLNEIFHGENSWTKFPMLLTLSEKNLRSTASLLTHMYNNESWQAKPLLLSYSIQTLDSRYQAMMSHLGSQQTNHALSQNSGLLAQNNPVLQWKQRELLPDMPLSA